MLYRKKIIIIMLAICTVLLVSSINVTGLNLEKQTNIQNSTNRNNEKAAYLAAFSFIPQQIADSNCFFLHPQ